MNVENCIEAQYRELMECSEPNAEYTHCILRILERVFLTMGVND